MKAPANILLRFLGILLLSAAALKGWHLLTEPVPNSGIWSYRPLLILTVELELALAIWLLSGLFKKAAWLAAILCFSAFSAITLYKALKGAPSCGCLGSVQVNPWLTLFAIDLPAVASLVLFPPKLPFPRNLPRPPGQRQSIRALAHEFLTPLPSIPRLAATVAVAIAVLGVSAPLLALTKPPAVTSSYEVLEPQTWLGKRLPVIASIDIAEQLKTGKWVVVFYSHNCSSCVYELRRYEKLAAKLIAGHSLTKVALIELPPYAPAGKDPVSLKSPCSLGQLSPHKRWIMRLPCALIVNDEIVNNVAFGISI